MKNKETEYKRLKEFVMKARLEAIDSCDNALYCALVEVCDLLDSMILITKQRKENNIETFCQSTPAT